MRVKSSRRYSQCLLTISFFGLLGLAFSKSVVADPTSYPMICRGGTWMYGPIREFTVNGTPNVNLTLIFMRGQTPRNPKPSECVWLDRAVRLDEPQHLTYTGVGQNSYTVSVAGIRTTAGPLQYLLKGVIEQSYFYVHVYKSGDRFIVTRLGP